MKQTILFLLCSVICLASFAQAPQAIPYQGVARDAAGAILANRNIRLQFSITNGSPSSPGSTLLYAEEQAVTTNLLGTFTANIGKGTPKYCGITCFTDIDWSNGSKFLTVKMDITGGTSFVEMGTTQMLSVPYALYAEKSGGSSSINLVPMPSIQIGTQIWSKQNLDVSFYRNGDPIPYISDPAAWAAATTGAWCYYNNDPVNGEKYGKLYNGYAVKDPRGLAPQGWHIPTEAEWNTLETKLGGVSIAGGKLKAAGTSIWTSPNSGATNSSGFAGLPGGYRALSGGFDLVGNNGTWWSTTELVGALKTRWLEYNSDVLIIWSDALRNGSSVRLVRD